MKNRGALNFSSRLNEESKVQKWLVCVECKAEVGEADAWYGVICTCETLMVPGYQIIKVGSLVRTVLERYSSGQIYCINRQTLFTDSLFLN